jgi:hypothetical protein
LAINDKKYRSGRVCRRYPTEYGLLSDFFASLSAPLLIRRSRKTNFRRIIQRNFSPPTLDRRVSRHSPCFRSLVPSRQSTMRLLGGIRVPLSHFMPSGPVEISVNFSTHPMGWVGFFRVFRYFLQRWKKQRGTNAPRLPNQLLAYARALRKAFETDSICSDPVLVGLRRDSETVLRVVGTAAISRKHSNLGHPTTRG